MQLYWHVPGWVSLCHRATRVWVDTLAHDVAVCDVSTRIARRLDIIGDSVYLVYAKLQQVER